MDSDGGWDACDDLDAVIQRNRRKAKARDVSKWSSVDLQVNLI